MQKKVMKKHMLVLALLVLTLSTCFLFASCNRGGESSGVLNLEDGSRPHYDSIFTPEDISLINEAMSEGASEQTKKRAVIALYNTANYSRKSTSLSLMVQNSDAGIPSWLGSVIMHGFNLRSANEWYYQLATEVESPLDVLLKEFAGLLKVAYTDGGGEYMYSIVTGAAGDCDCSIETFPYAEFELSKAPSKYDEESFKEELHYLDSMHEINNMQFCDEIIADGASIEYDAENRFYTVCFEVDMSADAELIEKWYSMAQKDMQVSGHSIEKYNHYKATLQVWDNGYAKYFYSDSDRTASGMASGTPKDEFKYFWVENEIMALLAQDASVENADELESPSDYIKHYSGLDIVNAKLSEFMIAVIVIACILGAVIATVIVIEVLVRCGKLPKLAERRKAKKESRREKKEAKRAAKGGNAIPHDAFAASDSDHNADKTDKTTDVICSGYCAQDEVCREIADNCEGNDDDGFIVSGED